MAILKPLPSSPTRFLAGMRTFSKRRSVVLESTMPILSSALPTDTPGRSFSTMKQVMPLVPRLRSTVANTVYTSARPPLVMKHFRPLRM